MKAIRWAGERDRYWGPFTYAKEDERREHWNWVLTLDSGDGDDYAGCRVRLSGFGRTLICALPPIIKPYERKVKFTYISQEEIERMGRDYYIDRDRKEYGVSYSNGFLQVFLGPQTNDSRTTKDWCKFLPWTQWRFVRRSYYDLNGDHVWTEPQGTARLGGDWEERQAKVDAVPTVTFCFADFDGEYITAKTRIDEWEWRFGDGWFKWLSFFRKPKVRRSLDLQFSSEVGSRKGSWKGGTIGHSGDMLPGELHQEAFERYCEKQGLTFIGRCEEETK